MEGVWRAGFDGHAEFSVPQALAHLPALRLRFEEYVQGRSAKDIFLEDAPAEQFAAAERCGHWLARFHTAAPGLGKVAETSEVLPHIRWWRDFLASFGEPLAAKSELLLGQLETAASALGPIEFCTGHGSYLPEHVFPTPDRTVTIDLDDYDLGDPARDVAWFVVGLERRALKNLGSLHALDAAVEAFCETYASSGHREVMARLPFYKAVQYLRGARNDAKSKPPGWREVAEAMLDEALGSLRLSVVGQD
jgi:aminoglycoside phosphotransferase (APT) family kinase protein